MRKYLILIVLLSFCQFQEDRVTAQDNSANQEQRTKQRELTYLQIVTTNAFYAPLKLYPNDENTEEDWTEGLGKLPKLGKLQQYEMGKYLRKYYDHFITSDPAEVDAFTSFEDRSAISLLSFLASLYAPTKEWQFLPGFKWQPIALNYMDENDIFFSYNDVCSRLLEERKNIFNSPVSRQLREQDDFLYSFWGNNSGMVIDDWIDVAHLYDIISKEERSGLRIPQWARMHFADMKRITDYAYTHLYNSTTSLQLKVGSLIDLLNVRMRVRPMPDNPSSKINVSVYVTHDWNLAALMSAMRLSNGLRPPPCATITFELYHEGEDEDLKQYVRTLFFNATHPEIGVSEEPHLLIVDGCTEYCPLSNFVRFFNSVIPLDHNELCGDIWISIEDLDLEEVPDIYPMYYDTKEMAKGLPL